MRLRTLVDTLMEGEAAGEYRTASIYDKVSSGDMFSYAMFGLGGGGSGNGGGSRRPELIPFNLNTPSNSSSVGSARSSYSSSLGSARDNPVEAVCDFIRHMDRLDREKQENYLKNLVSQNSSSFASAIGSRGSGFIKGQQGNIFREVCDGLTERYDFSGHDNTEPHLNQGLLNVNKRFNQRSMEESHFRVLDFGLGVKVKKSW